MVVIGIIGILAAVVIVAVRPTQQLTASQDAKRRANINSLQKALFQYQIDAGGEIPNQSSVSTDENSPTDICEYNQVGICVSFDALVPDYLASLPSDPSEAEPLLSGYSVYRDSFGRSTIVANYIGQSEGQTTDSGNPQLVSTNPVSTIRVSDAGQNLIITFSEDVVAGTGNITIKYLSSDATFEAIDVSNVTGGGTDTITIDPVANLGSATGFYVEIDTGAFDDTSGNSFAGIAGSSSWQFFGPVVTTDLVAHWEFNDGSGASATDSQASYDGTLFNMEDVDWQTSKPSVLAMTGTSLIFDGTNEYTNSSYAPVLDASWSISLWMKSTNIIASVRLGLFSAAADTGSQDETVNLMLNHQNCSTGKMFIYARDTDSTSGNSVCSNQSYNDGQWHHVVYTHSGTTMAIYKNGTLDASTAVTAFSNGTFTYTGYPFYIGGYNNKGVSQDEFDGSIDDVRFFDVTLSAARVAALARGDE